MILPSCCGEVLKFSDWKSFSNCLSVIYYEAYWADSLSVLFAIKNSYLRHCLVPLVKEMFLENPELNKWHQLSYGNFQPGQNIHIRVNFTLGFTNFRGPSQETWYHKDCKWIQSMTPSSKHFFSIGTLKTS